MTTSITGKVPSPRSERCAPTRAVQWIAPFFVALAVLPAGSIVPASAQESLHPGPFVQQFISQALAVLSNPNTSEATESFRRLFVDVFDVDTVARFSLGRYRRQATAREWADFRKLFEDYTVAVYARRLARFPEATVDVTEVRNDAAGRVMVDSLITYRTPPPMRVLWQLTRSDDAWKVVDVQVEGLSIALTQREEFTSIIRLNGGSVQALVEKLREQIGSLEAEAARKLD